MGANEELQLTRAAVLEVQRRVTTLASQWGDTLGVRRLCSDATRLGEDLDLLGAPAAGAGRPPEPRVLETVPDADYAPGFWGDSDDEGLGHPRG